LDQGNSIKWISSTLSRNIDKTPRPRFPNKLTKEPYHIYRHKRKKKKLIELQLNLQQPKLTSYMMIIQKGGKERTQKTNNREYSPRNEAIESQFS
jgi:hypothetical protein